ncbi:MAG: GIY-YIG nuclease family protein [Chloroflexi bacterium]|nr:GIY-YIG nuclease family protein [Chloroflexota bacterium]
MKMKKRKKMAGRRYSGGHGGRSAVRSSERGIGRRARGQTSGVVQYSIKNRRGSTKYIGTTNNPRRRAAEHINSGKLRRGDSNRLSCQGLRMFGSQ